MVCLNAKKCTDSTLCPDSQSACTIVQTRKHCSNVFRTCSIVCFIHMISYDHTKTRATQTFKEKHDCLERFIYIRIYIYIAERWPPSSELCPAATEDGTGRDTYILLDKEKPLRAAKLELWAIHHRHL